MSSEKKMITLKSNDGETFEIEEAVALKSETIKHLVEDGCADNAIPLPNVDCATLSKVLEYCNNHVKEENDDDHDLKAWDKDYVMDIDLNRLFDIIVAANYLDIKGLLDLTSQTVADNIKDYTPEKVRKVFNITNDFTPEEEAQIRDENKWAFEGVN